MNAKIVKRFTNLKKMRSFEQDEAGIVPGALKKEIWMCRPSKS